MAAFHDATALDCNRKTYLARAVFFVFWLTFMVSFAARGSTPAVIRRCADELVQRQVADGAIVMGEVQARNNFVAPYFANLAALGLVSASESTGDPAYRVVACRWADWYAAHMNANGTVCDHTGSAGDWHSTGGYDSTDSYAATFLELLEQLGGKDKHWPDARYVAVTRAVGAIRLTIQTNGLTLAKPAFRVMYTMDNIEVSRGLRAAVHIARLAGHTEDAVVWMALAARLDTAIDQALWDGERNAYYVGIQANGGQMVGQGRWYPDLVANLMGIGWGRSSERNSALYKRLVATDGGRIPRSAKSEADVEQLVWWGYAAKAAGDTGRQGQIRAALTTLDFKAVPVTNPALLGHLCRLFE